MTQSPQSRTLRFALIILLGEAATCCSVREMNSPQPVPSGNQPQTLAGYGLPVPAQVTIGLCLSHLCSWPRNKLCAMLSAHFALLCFPPSINKSLADSCWEGAMAWGKRFNSLLMLKHLLRQLFPQVPNLATEVTKRSISKMCVCEYEREGERERRTRQANK